MTLNNRLSSCFRSDPGPDQGDYLVAKTSFPGVVRIREPYRQPMETPGCDTAGTAFLQQGSDHSRMEEPKKQEVRGEDLGDPWGGQSLSAVVAEKDRGPGPIFEEEPRTG